MKNHTINLFCYRITKYNPKNRNSLGFYQVDDWISIHDIGTSFNGKKLTLNDYLKVENSHVEAILTIMDFLGLNSIAITQFEKHKIFLPDLLTPNMQDVYEKSIVGQNISREKVANLARLALREDVYCVLQNKDIFIRFDFDYYMFIGISKSLPESIREKIEKLGLYVEDISQSYLFYID